MFRPRQGVNLAAIAEHMRPALGQWFNARVQILRPAEGNEPMMIVYDSLTLLQGGGALIQPIRSATPVSVGTQATAIQGIRVQATRPTAGLVEATAGLRLRVVDGGQNPGLEPLVFSVKGQPDSSLEWGLILEATVVTSARWG